MIVRELIKKFKEEWLPVETLQQLDKKAEVTRALLAATGDRELIAAWDSMPLWSVRGIGPKRAMALWQAGVRPGNLRRHLKLLPDATRVALRYPVLDRIPRELVEAAYTAFVPPGEKRRCILVGSYRRGAATSGDLDILYTGDFDAFLQRLESVHGTSWQVMSRGSSKVAGIFVLSPTQAVEVDIWLSAPETRAFMLLFATGSKQHNVKMRFIAKRHGLKLNQYSLEDAAGKKIPAATERDIFTALKMRYLAPADRN